MRGLKQLCWSLGVAAPLVFFFLACSSEVAMSQGSSPTAHAPLNDISVTLTTGTVVRIRNMEIFQSQNGSALTVYIETPTPPAEQKRLAAEAKEIAALQIKSPTIGKLTSVRVAVCRTKRCLEMRETPEKLFLFVRKADGSLAAEKQPSATAVGGNGLLSRITSLLVGESREPVCGSQPPEGEFLWFAGGDVCVWITPTRGRIVAQRDDRRQAHVVTVNRQTNGEAHSRSILDSLAISLRSLGLGGRECEPGTSPAGAIRSWLYEDRTGLIVHVSEFTSPGSKPRLVILSSDIPNVFPAALCH